MNDFPIALQLYSVREELQTDPQGTLTAVAQMGYDGVELAGLGPYRADEMQTMLLRLGLNPVSVHVPLAELMADPQSVLGGYAAMGCRFAAIPHLSLDWLPGGNRFAQTLDAIRRAGSLAAGVGMQLLYHNHDFEFQTLEGEVVLDRLFQLTDPARLAVQLDVCWAHVGGVDPAAWLRKYAGRVPLIHLKDYTKTDPSAEKPFQLCSLGRGVVDIPAVLAAAKQAGTQWVVVEQDTPTPGKTSLACARESIHYLRSL